MELKAIQTKVLVFVQKNKYIVLIILLGLLFMAIPSKVTKESTTQTESIPTQQPEASIEERLTNILKQIDGAGKVEVMLTIAKGEETVYQTNNETSTNTDTTQVNTDTIIVTDSDKNQSGLVRQKIYPAYLGAIIVCQGADDPNVRMAITDEVAKITGLKTNHISILKMR